jgi:trehalose/maltose hydrolase-like predicted phosphorylase
VLEADGYRHIRGVIGPDEYHENIDDNAYTNVMARWNIRRALDVADLLREQWPDHWSSLSSRLNLDEGELRQWLLIAEAIAINLDPKTGLYQEFAGYFELEDIDLKNYSGRSVPMDVVLGRQRTQKSQVIKQADVIALLALLPDEFVGETGADNFRYYEQRCDHGSSLSLAMHGLVAARLGQAEKALENFRRAAAIDLSDAHVAIDGGVHIAALGGNWMLVVLGIAGISLRDDGIALNPQMPEIWRSLSFGICWRGRSLKIRIDQDKQSVRIALDSGALMKVIVKGQPYDLGPNALEICLGVKTEAA